MKLSRIQELLRATMISEQGGDDPDIKYAKASDLMSDVLALSQAFSDRNTLLITGLTNKQVVRTCEISGIRAIVFVRGKNPRADTIELARQCNITLLACKLRMFEACGILHNSGILAPAGPCGDPRNAR
ncbi:transcriptional regulator [candidate division WOR-3 bacterium]|nr:transcriptional regulator [candidate division WOR-3 bacterium]